MLQRPWWIATVLVCLGGCSVEGDSGQNRLAQMGDLDDGQLEDYCTWQADELGGEGQVTDCGDGSTYEVGTVDECMASQTCYDQCDLTVGESEDCTTAIAADPCGGSGDPSCEAVLRCFLECLGG